MGIQALSLTEKCSALFPLPPLSCWVLWNPIEVLLSPEDTVQIIIGFISAGDVDFLNELTLSSCPSSPFSLMLTHHPLLLLCLTPPLSAPSLPTFFLNSGVRALSFQSLFTLGRRSKQQDWSYIASWYCSRASLSIGCGWGMHWLGKLKGVRVKSGEIFCFSVCRCGWLFVCSGMSLICPPSTCKWVEWPSVREFKAWETAPPIPVHNINT